MQTDAFTTYEDRMHHVHNLYARAKAADETFSAALEQDFGKNACNMRYARVLPTRIRLLADAKVAADEELLAATRKLRDSQVAYP